MEDKLNEYLDNLISLLPTPVYDKIIGEIHEEDLRQRQEIESGKKISAFHVWEHGQEEYFQLERPWDTLKAASTLRKYLRKDKQDSFSDFCGIRQRITAEEFDQLIDAHMENQKKVTGVFALDFDKKEFSSVDAVDGWRSYFMQDVSAAAYRAFRAGAEGLSDRQRMAEDLEPDQHQEPKGARHVSVFRIIQDGWTDTLLAEDGAAMDTLHTALQLRAYLADKDESSERFAQTIPAADMIAPEVFQDYADKLRQGAGRVSSALDVDLNRATFSTMAGVDGIPSAMS